MKRFNIVGRKKENKQYSKLEGSELRNYAGLLKSNIIIYNNCKNVSSNNQNRKLSSVMKQITERKESKPEKLNIADSNRENNHCCKH